MSIPSIITGGLRTWLGIALIVLLVLASVKATVSLDFFEHLEDAPAVHFEDAIHDDAVHDDDEYNTRRQEVAPSDTDKVYATV